MSIEIGNRIRKQREYLKYTREELAEKLDVSAKYISDVEYGNRGMTTATLMKMSEVLRISTDYILLGREETTDNSRIVEAFKYVDEKYVERAEELLKLFIRSISD